MPDQPTADLRTLALNAVREGDHALSDLGECGRLDDQTAVVAAVLAAVLPAHRAMVLRAVGDELHSRRHIFYDDRDWETAIALVDRLAATSATTGLASTLPAVRGEAVPEEGPDGHSGAQGDAEGYEPFVAAEGLREEREITADCGHDLDAFERQAAELAQWRTTYDAKVQDFAAETRTTSTLIQALHTAGHRAEGADGHDCRLCSVLAEVGAIDPATEWEHP